MIKIKSKTLLGSIWFCDYIEPMECGCGDKPRATIQLKQTKEPTDKQITDAINRSKRK